MSDLARALLDELAGDPVALARLRELVVINTEPIAVKPAYTVARLAAEVGRTPRSIRAAIARGELQAAKRGRGYVIGADAVVEWTYTEDPPIGLHAGSSRPRRRRSGPGPMHRALKRDPA